MECWKRRIGGDPSFLIQNIRVNAKAYTVIGIMPSWFAYPEQGVQLWVPIYHDESPKDMEALDSHDFVPVGRLKPGVTETQARAEMSLIFPRLPDDHLDNPSIPKRPA